MPILLANRLLFVTYILLLYIISSKKFMIESQTHYVSHFYMVDLRSIVEFTAGNEIILMYQKA